MFPSIKCEVIDYESFSFLLKPNRKMEALVCAAKSRLFGSGAWNRVFSPGQMRRLFEGGGRLAGGDAYSSKYDN